ncbi:hypothetical protein Emed_002004 [Eimeria media]
MCCFPRQGEIQVAPTENQRHAATSARKVRELSHKLEAKRHEHEDELNKEFEKRREAATAKKATGSGPQAAAAATPQPSTKQPKAGEAKPIECLPSTQAKISATPPKVGETVAGWLADVHKEHSINSLGRGGGVGCRGQAEERHGTPQQPVAAATLEEVQRDIVEAEEEARRAEVEEASALSAQIEQEVVAAVAEAEAHEASSQAATRAPQTTHATPVIKHVVVAPLPPPNAPVGEAKTAEPQQPQHDTAAHHGGISPTADGPMSPAEAAGEEEEEEQREELQEEEEKEKEEKKEQQEEEKEEKMEQQEEEKQEEQEEQEEEQESGATAGGSEGVEADEEEEAETAATRQSRAERDSAEAERAERTVGGTPQGRRPQGYRFPPALKCLLQQKPEAESMEKCTSR